MSSSDADDQTYVTVRIPKRAAAVLDAQLEMATTPTQLWALIIAFAIAASVCFIVAAAAFVRAAAFAVSSPADLLSASGCGFIGVCIGGMGYYFFAVSRRTRVAYRVRGLI